MSPHRRREWPSGRHAARAGSMQCIQQLPALCALLSRPSNRLRRASAQCAPRGAGCRRQQCPAPVRRAAPAPTPPPRTPHAQPAAGVCQRKRASSRGAGRQRVPRCGAWRGAHMAPHQPVARHPWRRRPTPGPAATLPTCSRWVALARERGAQPQEGAPPGGHARARARPPRPAAGLRARCALLRAPSPCGRARHA